MQEPAPVGFGGWVLQSPVVAVYGPDLVACQPRLTHRCILHPPPPLLTGVQRYYIINALQAGRPDVVTAFFEEYGEVLFAESDEWRSWFGTQPLCPIDGPVSPGLEMRLIG